MSPRIAFFGSSLRSAYWNGAATYYRGLLRALHDRGCDITFYEPDAWGRQEHLDLEHPDYARVVVWKDEADARLCLKDAEKADLVVKASGVGVLDSFLDLEVLNLRAPRRRVVYWDVDAPATLERVRTHVEDPFRLLIPRYDRVFTYGGGPPVVEAYESLGAKKCVPVYNAHDPETHHPVAPDPRFAADLAFLGNRLPDRDERVKRFFLDVAAAMPERSFLLAGNGWDGVPMPKNVRSIGHLYTRDHNAFNCTPKVVLNVARDSMAEVGWSPATRVFEAAAAGACLITDAWRGIEDFFVPNKEILVAEDAGQVIAHLQALSEDRRRAIGEAARRRALADHTYAKRVSRLGATAAAAVREAA